MGHALAVVVAALVAGCGTSIHDEAARGNVEAVAAILDADPGLLEARNDLLKTPLHMAVTSGSSEMIALLLDRGADVNAADKTGLTPLHVAAWWMKTSRSQQLLDYGADIDARDQFGDTPLHLAAAHGRLATIKFLVENGADLAARNREGLTPLELARKSSQEEAVRLLDTLAERKEH